MQAETVVRAVIQAYAEGDLERVFRLCAPDISYCVVAARETSPYTFQCHGIVAFTEAILTIGTDFEIEAYELADLLASGNRVATQQRLRIVHRRSGRRAQTILAGFWTVEDQHVTVLEEFYDTALLRDMMTA